MWERQKNRLFQNFKNGIKKVEKNVFVFTFVRRIITVNFM